MESLLKGSAGYEQTSESFKTRQRRFWMALLSRRMATKRQRPAELRIGEWQSRASPGRLLLDRVV